MPWGVDEIECVSLTILGFIVEADGLSFNRDPALALDIHGIKHLLFHLTFSEPASFLNQAVSQGRLAVINMSDDGEITDIFERGHGT